MSKLEIEIECKDQSRELRGKISTEISEIDSPEELKNYLNVGYEAMLTSILVPNSIPLSASPQKLLQSSEKDSNWKPPSEKQLSTIHAICQQTGKTPEQIAAEYGRDKIEDMSKKDCWEFIKKSRSS